MLLAIIWGLASVFVAVEMPTDAKCGLYEVMRASSFGLLMCCLLVKTYVQTRTHPAPDIVWACQPLGGMATDRLLL